MLQWANSPDQTAARIKRAIAALDAIYPSLADGEFRPVVAKTPPAPLVVDYLQLRKILTGAEPPTALGHNASPAEYAVFLANRLPFEQERALQVLDCLLFDQATQWRDVVRLINQERLRAPLDEVRRGSVGQLDDKSGRSLRAAINRAHSLSNRYGTMAQIAAVPPYCWLRSMPLLAKNSIDGSPSDRGSRISSTNRSPVGACGSSSR